MTATTYKRRSCKNQSVDQLFCMYDINFSSSLVVALVGLAPVGPLLSVVGVLIDELVSISPDDDGESVVISGNIVAVDSFTILSVVDEVSVGGSSTLIA